MSRILLAPILACGLVVYLAAPARAELTAWDQAKVAALAKQLEDASQSLYDTFYKQPQIGTSLSRAYYRLQQDVRRLRMDARGLSEALSAGKGRDETLPAYEDLMQTVRRAQDTAREVFTTKDIQDSAAAARELLNQISPYYEADTKPLEPVAR